MDYFLLVLGILTMVIGLVGCVIPVIPGPPISFVGLIILKFSKFGDELTTRLLIIMGVLALVVTVLDYMVPIWGTRRMGGSKAGMWGAGLGLIAGIFFFPPIGLIIGPLVGAVLAESLRGEAFNKSFRAGMGSLLGFFLGIGLKLIASALMTFYFFKAVF
jgi:uncharacterized protein YqgC (DUF456 family)